MSGDLVGQLIGDKYRITGRLGSGGVAEVFEAVHEKLGQRFAVKVLKPEFLDQKDLSDRFLTEGRAAGAIGHPGIVQVYDIGYLPTGEPYLVMELLQGENLKELLKRKQRMSEPEAITVVLHVLDALGAAHKAGILHRDLKPENVVLVRGPEGRPWAKIIDFGLARALSRDPTKSVTHHGTVMGTPAFMAPEQVRGSPNVDARADLYSVGVMLYEMITGKLPYRGQSATEVMIKVLQEEFPHPRRDAPDVSPGLEQIILRATARRVERRYASADEFVQALRGLRAKVAVEREWRDEDAPLAAESTSIRRLNELVQAEFARPSAAADRSKGPASPPPPPPPRRSTAATAATPTDTVAIPRKTLYFALAVGSAVVAAAVALILLFVLRGA